MVNSYWDNLPHALRQNPFFQFSEDTNYVPAWDKIKPKHVKPAFDYALSVACKNLENIVNNKRKPTFRNTVEAYETAFELVEYFVAVLNALVPNTEYQNIQYQELMDDFMQRYITTVSESFQSKVLYERFNDVRNSPIYKNLSSEKQMLWEIYNRHFIEAGVDLSERKRKRLTEIDRLISVTERDILHNIYKSASRFLFVNHKKRLKGLSDYMLEQAAQNAQDIRSKRKWAFSLDETSYILFMQSAEDRNLRARMWKMYHRVGKGKKANNNQYVIDLACLRDEKAKILGYKNTADYYFKTNRIKDPIAVKNFLKAVKKAALPNANAHMDTLRKFAKDKDGIRVLKPWDVLYYEGMLQEKLFGYNDEDLSSYFELDAVLEGLFLHYRKIAKLDFIEAKENKYSKYHKDIRIYDVYRTGTQRYMGTIIFDLFDRPQKHAGEAWFSEILSQGLFAGKVRRPTGQVVTKISKSSSGSTFLLHDDLLFLMHEMGHMIHCLLSECRYRSLSGTNTVIDWVEFPSQFQENYLFEPEVLDTFARHYKTGEIIPEKIKKRLKDSRRLTGGTEELYAAVLGWIDYKWATSDPNQIDNISDFEKGILQGFDIMANDTAPISPSFGHIFGGEYEASFYGYQWSRYLAHDVFERFKRANNLYDRSLSAKFRKALSRGGTVDAPDLYRSIMGRNVISGPFIRQAGLAVSAFEQAMLDSSIGENNEDSEILPECTAAQQKRIGRHAAP